MPHELLTVAQMRLLDRRSVEMGHSVAALMEAAGAAVAREVRAAYPGASVLAVCGPGANGGDGLVAARLLRASGVQVRVATLQPSPPSHPEAARAWQAWGAPVDRLESVGPASVDVVIDALFGAGLARPLEGAAAALAQAAPVRVVAVDIPSGLPGDGEPPRGPVIKAERTVTFVRKKPAHVLEPGRSFCGLVSVDPIGAPEEALTVVAPNAFENHPDLWRLAFPRPSRTIHKHQRGHAMVLSGPVHATGAARLAASAALRIGAGLATVLCEPEAIAVNAAQLTGVMLRPYASVEEFETALSGAAAAVLGPAAGVGARTRELVYSAARTPAKLVLDADALTSFEDAPEALFAVLDAGDVLTPHWGEFRRLFRELADPNCSKLELARAAAARSGAVLLLKGSDTVVAAPDGRAVVNTSGTPYLATAGSGDVLAGMIGGLLAQRMPAFEAASAAAYLHGKAGEALGVGLIAEDLPPVLPEVLQGFG